MRSLHDRARPKQKSVARPKSPVARLVVRLGVTVEQLSELIGFDVSAVYEGSGRGQVTQLLEFESVMQRLTEWSDTPAAAIDWYKTQHISAFGGKTAETLVKSGKLDFLQSYLDSIANGGFA